MQVRLLNGLLDPKPVVCNASLVILADDDGLPICVAADHGGPGSGMYQIVHVNDPDFNATLAALGIQQRVQVDNMRDLLQPPDQLPPLPDDGE